jgi:tetratricopeptide (TPR) repeat protein
LRLQKFIHLSVFTALVFALSAGFASADDRNLLPKYGSMPETDWQRQANKAFIDATDQEYHGDRAKASGDAAARGWQFLQQGDMDTAMRRFNQAWLLNHENGIALWGMGAVEGSRRNMDSALKLFAEAEKFLGGDLNFSIDYAKALSIIAVQKNDKALLQDAFSRFESIYKKAPQNVLNLQNWAIALAGLSRFPEAWQKVKLAEASEERKKLDPRFVAALEQRMPRPKD